MVHGSCSSAGCYAITDQAIAELYAIAREAFAGGQPAFQFQAYPFRMRAENFAKHRADPNIAFWRNLKEGSDVFEVTREKPRVSVVDQRYDFGPEQPTVAEKRAADEQNVAELVARGVPAVRMVYETAGQKSRYLRSSAAVSHKSTVGSTWEAGKASLGRTAALATLGKIGSAPTPESVHSE